MDDTLVKRGAGDVLGGISFGDDSFSYMEIIPIIF